MRRLLTVLALGAVFYLGYQWWNARQPAGAPAPMSTPAPSASAPAKPASPGQPVPAPMPQPSAPEPPPRITAQVQMVNPGVLMEGTPHAALLNNIRQALEQGNIAEAEARLVTLPKTVQDDPAARKFTADLWNNVGVMHVSERGMAAGLKAFQTAVSLDPEGARAHVNLVHALWELRDPGLQNKPLLEKTAALAPEEPVPHLVLADIFQAAGDLKRVVEQLDLAAQHAGQYPKLQSFVQSVSARIKQDLKAAERHGDKASPAPRAPATPADS